MLELLHVVVFGEAVEVVEQRVRLRCVDFDGVGFLGLPVRREDDDRFGFHLMEDLVAEFADLRVHRVGGVVHNVGPAVGEEVDWCSGHGCCVGGNGGFRGEGKCFERADVFDESQI